MKNYFTHLPLILILFSFRINTFSQDSQDPRWDQNPSTQINFNGIYSSKPKTEKFVNRDLTKFYHTSQGDFLVPPNIIPFPSNYIETTVASVTMNGDQNLIFASWESYLDPFIYGTGFCFTSNGGTNWIGSSTMPGTAGNIGHPGPWIWPSTSQWPGRIGLSFISSNGYIGSTYSTNNGNTWIPSIPIAGNSPTNNFSTVDDVPGSPFLGRAYTVWEDFSGLYDQRIVGAYTTNGGVSWTGYGAISPSPISGHSCQACDVCVGPGGVVYVVWANCIFTYSTEDSLGFAKSTDGGVSWVGSKNNAVNLNGIKSDSLLSTRVSVNGYPRIAIDKSGGSRNGWIYVVTSEKFNSPARDSSDVCMERSTDGGTTWTHTLVNGDASGNFNLHASITVDTSGNVVVGYYDTRGLTEPMSNYYISWSNSGGNSWVDFLVSDHTFIIDRCLQSQLYRFWCDYTGINYSNGKYYPFWADKSTGHYQVWTTAITLVGIHNENNNLPNAYSLFQNYPNPFNPTTKIKFSIVSNVKSEMSNVKLVIYDMLGREVTTLINQPLGPGIYEVEWDATTYTSGVYYYRLIMDQFSETKKMVLVK